VLLPLLPAHHHGPSRKANRKCQHMGNADSHAAYGADALQTRARAWVRMYQSR